MICYRAKLESIEDEIHLNREKSKAEAAFYHKVNSCIVLCCCMDATIYLADHFILLYLMFV